MPLEELLAAWEADADVLARHDHDGQAETLRRMVRQVRSAAADYLDWLSEQDAQLKSGRSVEWLRARFAGWERAGHAKLVSGRRRYRSIVVPQRDHASELRRSRAGDPGRIAGHRRRGSSRTEREAWP